MILTKRRASIDEYRCDLTNYLDELAGLDRYKDRYFYFYHYIMADSFDIKDRVLPLRVPGGTVGSIYIDENNVITKIGLDTDYVVKTYPENVRELIQKYVGEKLEVEEETC